jgi:pimeloyl-ACP methyl ester carboxylesterase
MPRHHVILIPGFFAFAGLGELRYWTGVDVELKEAFAALGLEVDITEIETLPTASIRFRAAKVVEAIAAVAARDDGPIHLVGHSTGGIDARLAVAPHAELATMVDIPAHERVASIVTIATPHHGTPLASLFGSAMGQPILRGLAASTIVGLERGGVPLATLFKLGSLITRVDDFFGFKRTLVDQLFEQLLRDFDDERRKALIAFLDQVSKDRALVVQLTPDSLDLFNATTAKPDGIACGSVITCAKRPGAGAFVHAYDPYAEGLHLLYCLLWLLTSRSDERYLPALTPQQHDALVAGYGALPTLADNDGMAPSLSQVWGEVVHVTQADHLDVMGQYGDDGRVGIHADWLPSGSGFDRTRFRALWQAVAVFVTKSGQAPKSGQVRA